MISFEWDPSKAEINFEKHGVRFSEAITVFDDPLGITIPDPGHSWEEARDLTVGISLAGRHLIVAHTDRQDRIRLISARKLTRGEQKAYENEIQRRKR